jgi:hypothetical protein
MTSILIPAAVILAVLGAGAVGYHLVAAHKIHRVIAHRFRPAITVPQTGHDARWHALGFRRRAAVDAAMIGAALCLGVAWQLDRTAMAAGAVFCAAAIVVGVAGRRLSRILGARHHPALRWQDRSGHDLGEGP